MVCSAEMSRTEMNNTFIDICGKDTKQKQHKSKEHDINK